MDLILNQVTEPQEDKKYLVYWGTDDYEICLFCGGVWNYKVDTVWEPLEAVPLFIYEVRHK